MPDSLSNQQGIVKTSTPASNDPGVVVRNLPSGTQTISGTVTADQGAPAATANRWPVIPNGVSNSGQTFAAISVSNSATAIPSSPLSDRRMIIVANAHATKMVNLGPTNSVTGGDTGLFLFRLAPGERVIIPSDGSVTWYAIRDDATSGNVNYGEFK